MNEVIEITVEQWVDLTNKLQTVERIAIAAFVGLIGYLIGCLFFEVYDSIMKKNNKKDSKDLN